MKLSEVFESMKVSFLSFSTEIELHPNAPLCWQINCVFVCGQKNMTSVAENNVSTLGLGLDLESRYQEAEKVCVFVVLISCYVCFIYVHLRY